MKINYRKPRFRDLKPEVQRKQTTIAIKELTDLALTRMGNDMDIMVLYVLANDFGFRKHRLRKVYDGIFNANKELREAWQGNQREIIEDAKRELKSIGVDVELWNEQKRAWLDGGYKNDECWNSYGRKEIDWK